MSVNNAEKHIQEYRNVRYVFVFNFSFISVTHKLKTIFLLFHDY